MRAVLLSILITCCSQLAHAEETENQRKTSIVEATIYTGLPTLGVVATIFSFQAREKGWDGTDLYNNFKRGLTHPPVWDPNPWYVNYIGHPEAGAEFYLIARNRGAGPLWSFVYSTGISILWEYGLESWIGARPSIQDLLVTSTAGSVIGELRYWGKHRLMRGEETTLGNVFIVILDPIDAVYRALE